jgi:cobalt-zinc-cadmium efflux system outer membrane protein
LENEEMNTLTLNRIAVALCLLATVGCSSGARQIAHPEPPKPGQVVDRNIAINTGVTTPDAPTTVPASGPITLRQSLALAIHNNPRLAAFSWEVRAREAAALQAGLLPNPELTITSENFGGSNDLSGFDGAENTVVLSQLIELGGKRGKRLEVARLEEALAGWDYEVTRIDTFTDVALAFLNVLASQERRELAVELVTAGDEALRTVSKQVEAGAASSVEKNRAEVALASSRVELLRRTRELESARSRLVALWGSTDATSTEANGDLESNVVPPPALPTLLSQIASNPDIGRWAAELSAGRARVALEESKGVPDLTLGGGPRWFNESNDNAFVVEVSVPLPLFDRNQGTTLEARHRLAKTTSEQRSAQIAVSVALKNSYRELSSAYDTITALRNEVIPIAIEAYQGATSAYRRGVFRYLDVLDTQRTLFALRTEYLTALFDYHTAVARVERLIGRTLADLREE